MEKFAKMSVEELQGFLSNANNLTGVTAAEAVLQSKSIMFLSGEIATLKEALCTESTKIQESNKKLVKAQKLHSWAIIILTTLLFLATSAQAYLIFWTSKPERAIETYQELNKWSEYLKKNIE